MTVAVGGMNLAGFRAFTVSDGCTCTAEFLFAMGLSSWTGLDALQFVRDWLVFCLFGVGSSTSSFSFSFRASYGDFIGCAFPIGPFGVPSSVLSDLWRSWDALRWALVGATDDGLWNGFGWEGAVGRGGCSFVFFSSSCVRSVCVMPTASATSTKAPLFRLSSSPSCSSLLSL